jgi:hypothetical protein
MPICLHPAPLAVDERKGDQRLSLVCSPVSPDYRSPNRFSGQIATVTFEVQ